MSETLSSEQSCAGSMQLRKVRQLCERLFRLPSVPAMLSVRSQSGTVMQCHGAEDATLGDLDLEVQSHISAGRDGHFGCSNM